MNILHKVLVLLLIMCNCDNSNSMTTSSVINHREKRAQKAAQRDLVIVFDSTGSMGDDLAQLRAAAINIVELFDKKKPNPISNYILVEFNDPSEGIVQKTHLKSKFLADLNRITVYGGADCPEQCYAALEKAIAASNKGSFVFVFTDAYTHQAKRKQAIKELISKKQSQVFFFVAGYCTNKIFEHGEYSDIAIGSRGLFFETSRTAIGEIFEGINSLIEPTVSTGDVFTSDGKKIEKPLNVDGTVDNITLTITGYKPKIRILDPKGKEYTNIKTIANTTNVKIYRIDGPEPGTWMIEASADSPMSGLVSIASSLLFRYGFSTDAPKSIYRTSSAPLTGSTNYLSISPSDDLLIGQLASVDMIWAGNEKKLLLTRTVISDKEVLYTTPAFDLPKLGFKFYLNGHDSRKNTLRRLITPEIYPTDGSEKPDVSESLDRIEVQEGEPIELVCQVHSYTPITISWEKVGHPGILKQISTKSSERLVYTIKHADSSDSGDYTCKSVNNVGQSSVNTFVDVRATPLTITTPDKLKHPIEGQDAILKCVSFPTKRVVHSWSVNGSSILPSGFQLDGSNLVLKNVRREMSGTYTCTGTRGTETKSDTMTIDVYFPIKITSIILTTNGVPREIINIRDQIDIVNVTTLSIECKSEGNPKPSHGWRHNNVPVSSTTYYRIDPSEKSFSGKYDCFAYNDRSKALHQTDLNIIVKPSLQIGYNFAPRIVKGQPFKQNCPIQNKDADTIITWWTDKGTLLAFNVNANSEIETNAVETNMHGKFYCLAENKAGATKAEFEFDVLIPPRIVKFDKTDEVGYESLLGKRMPLDIFNTSYVNLTCNGAGNPMPKIEWFKDGSAIGNSVSLVIPVTDESSSGVYTCKSSNHLAAEQTEIELNVILLPRVQPGYIRAHKLTDHRPFRLDCPITGKIDQIKWLWNDQPVTAGMVKNNALNIISPKRDMSGIWTCLAINKAGATKAEFEFDVLFPPGITIFYKTDMVSDVNLMGTRQFLDIYNTTYAHLYCDGNGNPKPQTEWIKNNLAIENGVSLMIPTNDESSSGIYTCRLSNDLNEDLAAVELNIILPPKVSSLYVKPQTLSEQKSYQLKCPIYGKIDNIFWLTKNQPVPVNLLRGDTLHISSPLRSMSGTWECYASNKAGVTKVEFEFDVMFPPSITKLEKVDDVSRIDLFNSVYQPVYDIYNASSLLLICNAIGNPRPHITWHYAGRSVGSGNYREIQTNYESSSGLYTCEARNELDARTMGINLNVILRPKLNPLYNKFVQLTENDRFSMDCPITGKIDEIIWLWDNYPITNNLIKNYSLNIETPLRMMTGSWSCLAINKAGVTKAEFEFDVFYKPGVVHVSWDLIRKIEKYPGSNNRYTISLMKQNPLNLTCAAIGNPVPQIKWTRNNQVLYYRPNLQITSVSRKSDVASYKCQAINKVGFSEAIIDFDVQEKLYFNPNKNFTYIFGKNEPIRRVLGKFSEIDVVRFESEYLRADYVFKQDIQISEGQEHTLNCEMKEGYPYPKYAWFKNGELTETETALMNIKSALVNDTGLYKCIASNEFNTISILFYLYVLDTPKVVTSKSITVEKGQDFKITCISQGHFFTAMDWNYGKRRELQASNSFMFKKKFKNQIIFDRIVDCIQNREPIYIVNQTRILYKNENLVKYNKYGVLKYSTQMGTTIGTLELHIKNATVQNAGQYNCTVAKNVSESLNVIVVEPPWSKKPTYEEKESIQGVKFVLSCEIRGEPKPTITWWKDDMPIDDTFLKDNNIAAEKNNQQLNFRSPNYHNSGRYSCVGKNNFGTLERQISVKFSKVASVILSKIKFEELLNDYRTALTVQKGERKTLTCDAFPSDKSVTWFEVRQKPNLVKTKISNDRTISVELTERAMYLCTGPGDDAKGILYDIEVISKPKIRANLDKISVFIGEFINLQCPANGEPPPQYSWFKATDTGSIIGKSSSFVIRKSKLSDAGKYLCIAKNDSGEDRHVYNVDVNIKYFNFNVGTWSPCSFKNGIGRQYRPTSCTRHDTNQYIYDCPGQGQTRQCY